MCSFNFTEVSFLQNFIDRISRTSTLLLYSLQHPILQIPALPLSSSTKKKKKKNKENGFIYCASFIHSISFWVYTCIKNFPVIKFKLNRAGLSNRLLEITSRHLLTKNWVQTWIRITELLGLKDTLRSLSPIPLHVDTIADLFIRCLWWSMHAF